MRKHKRILLYRLRDRMVFITCLRSVFGNIHLMIHQLSIGKCVSIYGFFLRIPSHKPNIFWEHVIGLFLISNLIVYFHGVSECLISIVIEYWRVLVLISRVYFLHLNIFIMIVIDLALMIHCYIFRVMIILEQIWCMMIFRYWTKWWTITHFLLMVIVISEV